MLIELGGRSVFVSANGLRHHVLVYGPETGLPLVMLNGITSPAAATDFLAVQLAGRGFRVYVPDVRGRGLTPPVGPGAYRMDDYADDLAGLVEQLGLDRPVVIGHSMGARIAVRWSAHGPGRHRLLIAVDPPTSGPGREPYPMPKQQFLTRLREAKKGITVDDVTLTYPHWPLRERQVRADILRTCDETAVAETHDGFESEDFFPDFARLELPAVLIRGGESPMVPTLAADELKRTNPAVPTEIVPRAGHMVMWDNLPGFWNAVSPYLDAALSSWTTEARR